MLATVDVMNLEASALLRPGMHIHLVGIAGVGMSAIGRVLLGRGYVVSGSDMNLNALSAELSALGATVFAGHAVEHIVGADLLVISSAVALHNPEVVAARQAGIPVLKRADLFGHLMQNSAGIAVAGTHGKTTTTAMIAQILTEAGLDPTVILGGVLPSMGSNARVGQGQYFVIEADEYDHMFLGLRPTLAVVTNVDHDHPDIYPTPATYQAAFADFVRLLPANGRLFLCVDDPGALALAAAVADQPALVTTYGLGEAAHLRAVDVRSNPSGGNDFVVLLGADTLGVARLRVPGLHNVRNALAAAGVALTAGVDFLTIQTSLAAFGGVGRRFEEVDTAGGVTVVDDYAHHPTEIRATLAAARQRFGARRIWAVWQPHTYSRTAALLNEFQTCFDEADRVLILDVYRSREQATPGLDMAQVAQAMAHPDVQYIGRIPDAASYLLDRLYLDDVIITLSAGDGNAVGQLVLDALKERLNR